MHKKFLCSWSGGKDSCFALMKAKLQGYAPTVLLNVMNEEGLISRSHGIPAGILQAQAEAMQLPIKLVASSWQDYETKFTTALHDLKKQYSVDYAVFGDIDLQAHRDWEEKVCTNASLTALLPLWKEDRLVLVDEMLAAGIQTIIVSCNEQMGEQFLGKQLTTEVVKELERLGIDPCGENGEFHTLVLYCPLFAKPIQVAVTGTTMHEHYWFSTLVLK